MEASMAVSASILLALCKSSRNFPGSRDTPNPPAWKLSVWLDVCALQPTTTHNHPFTPAEIMLSAKLGARACTQCGMRQKDCSASSYHIFINELAEILKAVLFCYGVWIVAVLVGYTVGLQSSRARKQQGSKVLQPVSCREVKQCWQLLIPLICENRGPLEPKFFSSSNRASRWETDTANTQTKAAVKTWKYVYGFKIELTAQIISCISRLKSYNL